MRRLSLLKDQRSTSGRVPRVQEWKPSIKEVLKKARKVVRAFLPNSKGFLKEIEELSVGLKLAFSELPGRSQSLKGSRDPEVLGLS